MTYLSGKITNNPKYKEQFDKAYNIFALVSSVFNPASDSVEEEIRKIVSNPNWNDYMKYDVGELCKCDWIVMLPNWYKSKGAIIEWLLAKFVFKINIAYLKWSDLK